MVFEQHADGVEVLLVSSRGDDRLNTVTDARYISRNSMIRDQGLIVEVNETPGHRPRIVMARYR